MMARRTVLIVAALVVVGAAGAAARVAGVSLREPLVQQGGERSEWPGPDSARVAKLIDALGAGDPVVCEMFTSQIGNYWSSGAPHRLGAFVDASASVRAVQDSLHGRVREAGAIALLTSRLRDEALCTRRLAAKMLGRSRVPTPRLIGLLSDPSARVQEAAAYAIGSDERYAAARALEAKLSADESVAAMAAWALAQVHDSVATGVFVRALGSAHPRVRMAAAEGISERRDEEGRAPLERALRDTDAGVREIAARGLGEIGSERSVPALAAALDDRVRDVQVAAAEALGDLHELREAPAALIRAAESDDARLAAAAINALAEIHDPATVDVLIARLSNPSREIRLRVVEALGNIGSTKAVPGLMRALNDADPEVRRAAAEGLGEIREGER